MFLKKLGIRWNKMINLNQSCWIYRLVAVDLNYISSSNLWCSMISVTRSNFWSWYSHIYIYFNIWYIKIIISLSLSLSKFISLNSHLSSPTARKSLAKLLRTGIGNISTAPIRKQFTVIPEALPSGKHTKNYGKSPCLMGQLTISGHFP